jgi:16S rRNA U516 pseudouridylate synthase RsuA-like enzyme
MFGALGNPVTQLHRTSTEEMQLDAYDLKPGEFAAIERKEIERLIIQPSI